MSMLADPFVELTEGTGISIDLRYATIDNFTGINLYGDFTRAYLHRDAAKKFHQAVRLLQNEHPGYKVIIFDALRPRAVQRKLWEHVRGTPQQKYVAEPERGSIHNYGLAVDCSLLDAEGRELDMGTGFDFFGPLAEPQMEEELLQKGELSEHQIKNRKILRKAMVGAGFLQLAHEWWHYDAVERKNLSQYTLVE